MTHRTAALALAVVLLAAAPQAQATVLESCCACVPLNGSATVSGGFGPTATAAFCSEVDSSNEDAVTARCDALGEGFGLACLPNIPGPTCFTQLADEGIFCPTAGVPAASPHGLLVGLLLLSGIGVLALRRR